MTGLPRLRHDLPARRTSLPGILAVFLIASAFTLTTPQAGGAEEAPKTDNADEVSPEVLPPRPVVETDPVVITTQRHAVPIDQVGAAVTVIQGEDLRRRPSRDVLQALREVPGVSVVQTGSRGGATSLFVRGGEADQNLVLIDGVQVNNGGGAYDFANLTTENIERIEIVRGPASGLYG
jgi:outer membrane cobalamin receptor